MAVCASAKRSARFAEASRSQRGSRFSPKTASGQLFLHHGLFGWCWGRLGIFVIIFALDRVKDFLAMDRDLLGCIDTQSHLVATDINDRDLDIVRDNDALVALSRQNKPR